MPARYLRLHGNGFTLIELLVVISIIAIIASVTLATVSTGRTQARLANAHKSLRSAQTIAVACLDEGKNINDPLGSAPVRICSGMFSDWPTPLPADWQYGDAGSCIFDGNVADGTFMFCAYSSVNIITCTKNGCTVSCECAWFCVAT